MIQFHHFGKLLVWKATHMHSLCPRALLPLHRHSYEHQNTGLRMLIALFIISQIQVTNQRLINNKKDKLWLSHPTEYCRAIKNVLSFRTYPFTNPWPDRVRPSLFLFLFWLCFLVFLGLDLPLGLV